MFFEKWQNFVHYKLVTNWLFMLLFFNSMLVLCIMYSVYDAIINKQITERNWYRLL